MPTPEEIKSIAHEYGVLLAKDIPLSNCLKNEVINSTEDYIVEFLQHLSKDYCIVPKSEVIGLWNEINNDAKINIENGFPDYAEFNKLQLTPIEILFGTELFNEEKEVDNA